VCRPHKRHRPLAFLLEWEQGGRRERKGGKRERAETRRRTRSRRAGRERERERKRKALLGNHLALGSPLPLNYVCEVKPELLAYHITIGTAQRR